jgi:hypothetical protein
MKLDPEFDNFQFVIFEISEYVYQKSIDTFANIIITKPNIFIIFFMDRGFFPSGGESTDTLIEFLNYKLMHPYPPIVSKPDIPETPLVKSKKKKILPPPPPPRENRLEWYENSCLYNKRVSKGDDDTVEKIKNEFIKKYQFKGKVIYVILPSQIQIQ